VFLKCGNVVHAILKNSQCWCVDGVSKFVLRIRPLTYYRIELPYETEDEKISVGDLKTALPTVLRYEVTPCPFKRAFTVEIPEDAMAPRRKKAWRPKDRKDSLLSVPGSNQSSPSDGRSEWLDSASTGEDTDGGATDDSGVGPKAAKSTTPEPPPAGDQSPIFTNTFELPIDSKPTRRSVTEIPQTFTSLRAKFDSSPVPEGTSIPEEPLAPSEPGVAEASEQNLASQSAPAPEAPEASPMEDVPHEIPDQEEAPAQDDAPTPRKVSARDDAAIPNASPAQEEVPALQEETILAAASLTSGAPEESSTSTEAPVRDAPAPEDGPSTEAASQIEGPTTDPIVSEIASIPNESLSSGKPVYLEETPVADRTSVTETRRTDEAPITAETMIVEESRAREAPTLNIPTSKAHSISDCEADAEHDDSFSSTPDSFHSADLTSPSDSISAHTTPEKNRDLPQKEECSSMGTEQSLSHKLDVSSIHDTSRSGSPVASPNFAYYESRERPTKPSLAIPSDSKKDSQPIVKGSSPPTDFNQMSTQFRRRAQATRQRDVSPMPPPSTIYQPTAGTDAKSILSKTLSLVLVPPISLFIILLHITARIVISPATASSPGESTSRFQSSNKEPVTEEDDFSFPLERESSSEYEDAEVTRKLDPWDLD
jgi:hypothetical protein